MPNDRDQYGMTVVELVVVVGIFSIVSLLVLNFLDSTTAVTGRIDSNVQTEKDAQLALREIGQELRGAAQITSCPSVTWAAGTHVGWPTGFRNCVIFTVSRNVTGYNPVPGACPKSVFSYALVAGTLRVDRHDFSATCSVTARYRERIILDKVVNSASQPLFSYFDVNGSEISTAADIPNAESVRLHVVSQPRPGTQKLDFKTTVALRNNNNR